MPKYTIPTTTPSDEATPFEYSFSVYLPVNKEIADTVDVDDVVEIHLKAVVKGLNNREQSNDADRYEIQIELREVDVYGENEYENMAREDE